MFNLIKIISNLLNINNKEKIEEEKSDKTNIKYIYINKNMILDGVKYEIGKRYHSEIEFKNNIYDFNSDLLVNIKDYKIIKIKIFDDEIFTTKNFKIIKEINYKQFLNSSKTKFQLISIIKNKEEKVIKKFIKELKQNCFFENWKFDAIINSGLHQYLDKLLELPYNNYSYAINKTIETYGRNKDLDRFLWHDYSAEIIVNFGRNKDLDLLYTCDDNVICAALRNGRYKDIKHFLYDKHCNIRCIIAIIKTEIDQYIKIFLYDNILQEHICELSAIKEIAKHCNKKDLDYIVNKYKDNPIMNEYKDNSIKIAIAERGYDDHIRLLLSEKNDSDIRKIASSMIE